MFSVAVQSGECAIHMLGVSGQYLILSLLVSLAVHDAPCMLMQLFVNCSAEAASIEVSRAAQ
jgi:hypothetical protein